MELIKEIHETDLNLDQSVSLRGKLDVCYRLRKAARALIFQNSKVAVLSATKLHLHKLPGGGIEDDESVIEGLSREILEETGCKVGNIHDLGITIEYRNAIELLQISYVFTGTVVDSSRKPQFTEKEKNEGFELAWMEVEGAIKIMKTEDSPATYAGKFILARDLAILEYYVRFKT
jgi:8-oxo-dGTP pyrophosphatase MutT (NUDIX family)